jgi:hypothetical protein
VVGAVGFEIAHLRSFNGLTRGRGHILRSFPFSAVRTAGERQGMLDGYLLESRAMNRLSDEAITAIKRAFAGLLQREGHVVRAGRGIHHYRGN